jgi:hypothetical protein
VSNQLDFPNEINYTHNITAGVALISAASTVKSRRTPCLNALQVGSLALLVLIPHIPRKRHQRHIPAFRTRTRKPLVQQREKSLYPLLVTRDSERRAPWNAGTGYKWPSLLTGMREFGTVDSSSRYWCI